MSYDSSTQSHGHHLSVSAPQRRPDLDMSSFVSDEPVEDPSKGNPTILQPWGGGGGWMAQS
jgi:hypothetical protein